MRTPPPPPPPPSWQVLLLAAPLLEPKILATASCVSRSWNSAMSSDDLWRPHCISHFPSAFLLLSSDPSLSPSPSPRRIFSLLSSSVHRRLRRPSPLISLRHLLFAVDVFHGNTPLLSIARQGDEIVKAEHGEVFCFDFEVDAEIVVLEWEEVRVKWTVVMEGWTAAVTLMDRVGKGRVIGGSGMWFSEEELPGPACCSQGAEYGGVAAEMGMELDGGRKTVMIRRVSLGLLRSVWCRYMGVDDALLYLQPFLLDL